MQALKGESRLKREFEVCGYQIFRGYSEVFLPVRNRLVSLLKMKFRDLPLIEDEAAFGAFMGNVYETDKKSVLDLYSVFDRTPEMMLASFHPRIVVALRELGLKSPIVSSYPTWRLDLYNNPQRRWFPWHQDSYHENFSENSVTVWIPLLNSGPETKGKGLVIKEGSHRIGIAQTGANKFEITDPRINDFKEVEHSLSFGDFVVLNSLVVHRSGVITEKPGMRLTLQFRYDDLEEPNYIAKGWPRNFSIVDAINHNRFGI
ncbi:MAG: hypothetical protein COV44_07175 [Deltaproteobacteria bacterium CG11_big_fil_rev_8_21_14_0_20_45_16]|nr:MAG: hypothetical protein COV44_07175 [Deltaproteobacteria bacterium CG11_big_fil_rev_8_21_14_0_20_45_16]